MKKKSSLFLGIFILLITIATILFFKINQPSESTSLSYQDQQFFAKREKINTDRFKFLNKNNSVFNDSNNNDFVSVSPLIVDEVNNLEMPKPASIHFLFLGDIMLDRHVGERLEGKNVSFLLSNFSPEEDFWHKYDFISANLEGAVTNEGAHYAPHNSYDFAFAPERIAELKDFNFSYFALANNHFRDQGDKGVLETRENLNKLGFYFSGATDTKIEPESRLDLKIGELKLSLISLSMVQDHFSLSEATEMIKEADRENDLVIVNIHWGVEYDHFFNTYQKERGRALVDAGADLIIGHHPHVVQGMEIYNGKPIFYSLGNFIFDQYFSEATQEGLALDIDYQADELIINFLPYKSKQSAPKLLVDEAKAAWLKKYLTWSKLETDLAEQVKAGYLKLDF